MVLKPDQERVKKMIKETLTLLCKNGLAFDLHFSIEALIGVTLDDKDVFLVNINELVKSDKVPEADGSSEEQSVGASGEEASEEEYNGSGQLTPGTGHRRKRHKRRGIKREPNRGDSSNEEEPASKMSNDRRDPDRARVKKEANNDSGSDSNVIVIKEELDDCWNESGTPDNASFGQYMNMPSTSQDQNFTSLSDMSLLPIGSQDSGQVWSQAAAYASGGSMGRGLSRSSTSTSTSQLDPSQEVVSGFKKKRFRCDQCGSFYSSSGNLAIHKKLHRGEYPYYCQFCGKGCSSTTQLNGHMTVHTGKMLFRCDVCGKRFSYKHHLKYHMDRHKIN